MSENIIQLEPGSKLQDHLDKNNHVIVDFYADWCGPCRKIAQLLEKHVLNYPDAVLVKVNVDDHEDLTTDYNASGIPYVIHFHQGKKIDEFTGYNEEALSRMFERTK